jgi:hypothetical protein
MQQGSPKNRGKHENPHEKKVGYVDTQLGSPKKNRDMNVGNVNMPQKSTKKK